MIKKKEGRYEIKGNVIDQNTKEGLPNLRVDAWDKDLFIDDFLGTAITDKSSNFTINFDDTYYREICFDRRPDVYFKVYKNHEFIYSTEDSVLWNVKRDSIQVTITIDLKPDAPDKDSIFNKNARTLMNLPSLKKLKKFKENDLSFLLSSSLDHKGLLITQWEAEGKLNKEGAEILSNIMDLMRITSSNAETVGALSKKGINITRDLVKFNQDSLVDIMEKGDINAPNSKDISSFAEEILSNAEAENPSSFYMHRIIEKPDWLEIDTSLHPTPSKKFKEFYKKNKNFDIKNEPIISLDTGVLNSKIEGISNPTPDFIKELSLAQQSLQLSSDSNMAALLFKNEINIKKAVNTTHQTLIRTLGIDAAAAVDIKQKAQAYHETAINGFLAYRDIISNPFLQNTLGNLKAVKEGIFKGIGHDSNWENIKELNGLRDVDTIEDLFGSQDYCECEHCKSVLSPAAYFVDLMRFTEKRVLVQKEDELEVDILPEDHPIHLKVRRPDLWHLELTCDNTNIRIPYVEIINEVLTAFINEQLGTGKSISQRLLQEQPDLEFLLPYNKALDEVRTWLTFFSLTRLQVLEYLYPSPNTDEKLMLAIESLNLSKEQYDLIVDQTLSAQVDLDVLSFRKKSGLNSEETERITKMKFWDNKLSIIQKKDTGDIQKYHYEFSSTLTKWKGKLHRLIRLWKISGWTLNELDLIFQAYAISHSSLKKPAILKLAAFRKIQSILGYDVNVLVGILNGLEDESDEDSGISWKQLLPNDWIAGKEAHLEDLLSNSDDDAFNLLLRLQGVFGLDSNEVLACLSLLKDKIGTPVSSAGPVNIVFNTGALNMIYRYVQLYKWTGVSSFEAFVSLLEIWGGGTVKYFDSPSDDIPVFVHFLRSFEENKISLEDIIYLFGDELSTDELIEDDVTALTADQIGELMASESFLSGDKFILLFNNWTSIDTEVLLYYWHFMEVSDTAMDALFSDLEGNATSDQTYINFSNIKLRLERLEFLVAKFKIDIDTLKLIGLEAQDCTYPKLGYATWQDKEWVKELAYLSSWINETRDLRNFNLWDTLRNIEKEATLAEDTQKAIAKWKQIDVAQVATVVVQTSSIREIKILWDRIDWAKKLNVNSELIDRLKTDNSEPDLKIQSQMLQNAIRSKYEDNEIWETQIQDFKNILSSNKRDALCNFVIFNNALRAKGFGFDDREDLYRYFLLDVSMGDCFTLPRIVAATNSLQVYIHRCLMGFEQSQDGTVSVLLDVDEKEEWEWRKNYRIWEANRKIFLYPENYIEPEIRDNKSPEFKELEDELLQQKLNSEVVENAYKKYLQQTMTLAELKIAGAYNDKEYNRIYLFGRTNRQPVEYYYRHVEFLENGGAIWSNWEKMNVAIPVEDVSALRYGGKIYIFWTTFQRKDISVVASAAQNITQHIYDVYANYSYLQVDKKWSAPQQIELNFRSSSTFDPFLRLEQYKSQVTQSEGEYLLNERGVEIRENVLKEFERTVYRKPYPIKTDDRNILKLNYIWTDKKEALQPVYKYTRGVIDAITLDVKLKFNFLGIGMIEFDVEFSFNRFDRVIHTATTPSQSLPPASLNPGQRSIKFTVGFDELEFVLSFESDGTRYNLKTGDSSGNEMFFFKNQNSEIKSGKVYLYPRIDYIPINEITSEENLIKIADQKKESSSIISGAQSQSFAQEYNTYFDGFSDFFVSDGTDQFAEGNNDYKVQQLDMVAKLTTPGITDTNEGHNLNPEQIQMLWDKVSLSIDDLLDHTTQRHVSTQIDYSQSFGNYFYELFFHIPMRIADHLNAAGKYREANQWYGYIYNSTAIKDKFEQLAFPNDVNWRFAAFRNIGIQKLQEIYSDPNAIEMYQRNPGNPHAIARLRIGAYQKNVVMKYLDNLMDWADYLFEQYTPESTSEARHLYNIVKSILGDKPDKVGECKDTRVLTYSDIDINENSEFIYNLFTVSRDSSAKPGYYDFESQKRRMSSSSFRVLENSSYQVKSNLKSSEKISYPTDKASDRTKGMQDILKHTGIHKVKGDQKPDKAQGRPETPQVYINTEVDLIFCFPHNKDFIQYWDRVNDRIIKLNNCLDINGVKKEMPAFSPEIDPALLARMVAGGMSFDEILATISGQLPNYRFSYLIEKAKQFCGTVQSFGGALFTAIEKRDGEELTLLRSRHEQNIMLLTTKNKKKQLEQAQTNQASLLENKTNIEQRKTYYEELIEEGLIEWEDVEQVAKWTAGSIRITEGVLQLLSAAFFLIPQLGSPFAMKYGGQELGSAANGFSNALAATAKIADNVAILAGLEGSHQRREQGWQFQLDTATQELKGMAEQLRASEISVAMAEFDLEIHNTNIEQYKELDEFYTNKFSNHQHYTFQVNELQKLYRMAFNLANDLAMQAQQAFEFERYGTTFNTGFIQSDNWNNGKAGLLSGERLMTQLLQLEKEYLDTDKRKMEITQHFSMLQITPDKLLELKTTGECADFSIPEAAFDLLYPGFFRRIIKSVRITIPCVVGPYTNIGATLSLGTNKIRTDKDSALIDFNFNGCAMIATSNAQNDAGQFELNFRDERYLPFEGAGAVSSWTLSLPKAKQAFDYNTISDVIFHISYAADYDGVYKDTVETNLITELNSINSTGFIRAFSLQHDFPNEWSVLNQGTNNADVILQLKKEHFPYFTNIEEIAGIEPNCYTIGPSNKLEEKSGNEGISKENKMEIKIPKEVGDNDYKDIIFFAKYLVN